MASNFRRTQQSAQFFLAGLLSAEACFDVRLGVLRHRVLGFGECRGLGFLLFVWGEGGVLGGGGGGLFSVCLRNDKDECRHHLSTPKPLNLSLLT